MCVARFAKAILLALGFGLFSNAFATIDTPSLKRIGGRWVFVEEQEILCINRLGRAAGAVPHRESEKIEKIQSNIRGLEKRALTIRRRLPERTKQKKKKTQDHYVLNHREPLRSGDIQLQVNLESGHVPPNIEQMNDVLLDILMIQFNSDPIRMTSTDIHHQYYRGKNGVRLSGQALLLRYARDDYLSAHPAIDPKTFHVSANRDKLKVATALRRFKERVGLPVTRLSVSQGSRNATPRKMGPAAQLPATLVLPALDAYLSLHPTEKIRSTGVEIFENAWNEIYEKYVPNGKKGNPLTYSSVLNRKLAGEKSTRAISGPGFFASYSSRRYWALHPDQKNRVLPKDLRTRPGYRDADSVRWLNYRVLQVQERGVTFLDNLPLQFKNYQKLTVRQKEMLLFEILEKCFGGNYERMIDAKMSSWGFAPKSQDYQVDLAEIVESLSTAYFKGKQNSHRGILRATLRALFKKDLRKKSRETLGARKASF